MSANSLTASLALLILAGASVMATPSPTLAQTAPDARSEHEEITVVAPHVVRREVKTPAMGKQAMPIELVTVERRVSYHDLDLSKQSDADIFEKRIHDAAADGCKALDKRFPPRVYIPIPSDQDCVGTAEKAALVVAREIISASANR
jgi:UrcA family protein